MAGKNISRGMGYGESQVYDTSGNINLYAKILGQQKAQREKEVAEIGQYLSTAKTDGLRDADREDYFKKYNEWRDEAIKSYKAKGGIERAKIKADADSKLADLNRFVKESKAYGTLHQDISNKFLEDRFRNQFQDTAVTKWQRSAKLPLSSPEIVRDPSLLARQLDTSAILDDLNKVDDQLMQTAAKYDNPAMRDIKNGDKVGTEYIYTKRVTPDVQAINYGIKYDTDRNFKAFIQNEYADLFDTMSDKEAKAAAIQDLTTKRPLVRQDAPKMQWQPKEDNWKEKMDYAESLRRNRPDKDGEGADPRNFQVSTKTFYRPATVSSTGKAIPEAPVTKFDRYVAVNPVAFGTSQLESAYNIATGKNERLPGDASLELTGVGYTTVKGGKKELKASTVDADGTEYLINLKDVPVKIRDDKYYKAALSAVGTPPKNIPVKKPKTPVAKTGTIRVELNGNVGEIPADQIGAFLKKYPKAKRL